MANITAATLVSVSDKIAALYLAALGTSGSGFGLGDSSQSYGAAKKANDLVGIIQALPDPGQQVALLKPANDMQNQMTTLLQLAPDLQQIFNSGLKPLCVATAGTTAATSIDTFLKYYNIGAGGPWTALLAPDFGPIFQQVNNGVALSAYNVYFEVLQGATYTNGVGKFVANGAGTGTFTAGQAIDSARYAGGFGQLTVSGSTGSGNVTVTGNWRKTDGTLRTAAASITSIAGDGTTVITPPAANELLLSVTNITIAAGISAGTFYAEAKRPSGRTNPPT